MIGFIFSVSLSIGAVPVRLINHAQRTEGIAEGMNFMSFRDAFSGL